MSALTIRTVVPGEAKPDPDRIHDDGFAAGVYRVGPAEQSPRICMRVPSIPRRQSLRPSGSGLAGADLWGQLGKRAKKRPAVLVG